MKAEIPDRTYFKIGEVASILGVKPHIVRYWTDEFPQIRLQKTKSGQRLFRRRDIEMLLAIDFLVNEQEFTVAGAKTRLKELRAIGVKNKDLRQAIRRLGSIDVIKSIVLNDAVVPSNTAEVNASSAAEARASDTQEQGSLTFRSQHPSTSQDERLKAERDEALAQQAAYKERIHALEQTLRDEREAYERRIELYKQSVVEEREFFADEQKILTLYIEELEEALYSEQAANEARESELKALDTHVETLRTHVRTHAMQRRYALRKTARDAKQHKETHARARALAQRLVDRVHAQRLLTGHETRDDSD